MERNNHKHQGQQVHPRGRRSKCVHHLRFNGGKSNPHRLIGHASQSIEGQHPPSFPVSTPWCCVSGIFCWCSTFSLFLANLRWKITLLPSKICTLKYVCVLFYYNHAYIIIYIYIYIIYTYMYDCILCNAYIIIWYVYYIYIYSIMYLREPTVNASSLLNDLSPTMLSQVKHSSGVRTNISIIPGKTRKRSRPSCSRISPSTLKSPGRSKRSSTAVTCLDSQIAWGLWIHNDSQAEPIHQDQVRLLIIV